MTTIVYNFKEKVICCDSRATKGHLIADDNYKKVVKNSMGLTCVVAGLVADVEALVETFPSGYEGMSELEAQAFIIYEGDVYECAITEGKYIATPIDCNAVLGSGGSFALAAMDFGRSAKEAVKYAMTRDAATGGKIRTVKVK